MAGVDTYKNATADMIEGGIAGTVNLRTHVPFDSEGFVAAFSAELGYGSLAEEATPAGSMLLSNRWDTGIGEFGVMLNAAYSEVVTESQGVQLLRFFNATGVEAYGGGTKWIPGGVDLRNNTYTAPARVVRSPRSGAAPKNRCSRRCSTTVPSTRTTGKSIQSRPAWVIPSSRRAWCSTRILRASSRRHAGVRVRQPRRVRARRHQRRGGRLGGRSIIRLRHNRAATARASTRTMTRLHLRTNACRRSTEALTGRATPGR